MLTGKKAPGAYLLGWVSSEWQRVRTDGVLSRSVSPRCPQGALGAVQDSGQGTPSLCALQQVFPTVVGDLDSSGSLNAQVLLLLAERLRAKAVFQVTRGARPSQGFPSSANVPLGGLQGRAEAMVIQRRGDGGTLLLALATQTQQSKFLTWQFDGEYRGDDYTATLTLGNPDLIGESGENLGQGSFCLGRPLARVGDAPSASVRALGAGWGGAPGEEGPATVVSGADSVSPAQ